MVPREALCNYRRVLRNDGVLIGALPINQKHLIDARADAPDCYLFDDCQKLVSSAFGEIEWFYHDLATNKFTKTDEGFLRGKREHTGNFVFVARPRT